MEEEEEHERSLVRKTEIEIKSVVMEGEKLKEKLIKVKGTKE